jgi:two-component system, OmpR family, response regulator
MLNQENDSRKTADKSAVLKVLIVEDSADCAYSSAKLLRLFGHDVEISLDGRQAIEAATLNKFDVVLLDIGHPEMDGYEVAQQLIKTQTDHPPLIIAVTGQGQESDRRRAAAAGIDLHLTKPIDQDNLTKILRTFRQAVQTDGAINGFQNARLG